MIDTNLLKDNPQRVLKTLKSRNYDFNIESYESLEAQRKTHQTETEDLQAKQTLYQKNIDCLKKRARMILLSIPRLRPLRLSLINAQVN